MPQSADKTITMSRTQTQGTSEGARSVNTYVQWSSLGSRMEGGDGQFSLVQV